MGHALDFHNGCTTGAQRRHISTGTLRRSSRIEGRDMAIRAVGPFIILAFGAATVSAAATDQDTGTSASDETTPYTESPEAKAARVEYERKERAVYDALIADPSPHTQILASHVYLGDDGDPSNALRPKAVDVLARAVEFAPDDAMVQWIAATEGSYMGSACAPTRWPDAEVANLIRLEPDNAAAWQFGVALARAKGDEAGVDDALSRMATARRADDHMVEEIAAWTALFVAHPELGHDFNDETGSLTPREAATVAAVGRVTYLPLPAREALKAVCTPDPASERTWQRLGWCIDAGRVLAEKGNSLALRKRGLVMLAAADDRSDARSTAQRQYDWLEAHGVSSMWEDDEEDSGDMHAWVSNWEGASGEVDATERRLKRLGLPLSAPAGWTKPAATPEKADGASTAKLYGDYLASVFADMSASAAPEERAFAALNEHITRLYSASDDASRSAALDAKPDDKAIAALGEANPGNLKVQWMIAASSKVPDETRANAIATVQQAEGDNAAAWALSLELTPASSGLADTLLQRMAASTRYDAHAVDGMSIMLAAIRRKPMPQDLLDALASEPSGATVHLAANDMANATAYTVGSMSSATLTLGHLMQACKNVEAPSARRDDCVAIGQLLVRKSASMLNARIGELILTQLAALDGSDADRARHFEWWYEALMNKHALASGIGPYVNDVLATGNEIDALRHAADRLGKAEPPADWKPRLGNGTP
ncbi:MAG TPA: hypothetical protein VKB52_09930 [Rhodanobacteraceae bacterium]|nr:hypothetical protein [Rhodanobacteraceae bacterium]